MFFLKPNLSNPLFSFISLFVFGSIAHASNTAEASGEESWYQIEVLVFSYERTAEQERWPEDLSLKYPNNLVSLQAAAESMSIEESEALTDEGETSAIDNQIDLNDLVEPASMASELIKELNGDIGTDNTGSGEAISTLESGSDTGMANESLAELEAVVEPQPSEQAYTLLKDEEHSFADILKKLQRQSDIRILFHEAWRQTIAPRDQSESILIRGGNRFDDHYELEGYLNFGLERYLHIRTDLWLSRFVDRNPNIDEPLWPLLPSIPVTTNQAVEVNISNPFETKIEAFNNVLADPFANTFDNSGENLTTNQQQNLPAFAVDLTDDFFDLADRQYRIERTVTMRQQRRMRSKELHYIDHPLMGLLVRIIPYQKPEKAIDVTSGDMASEDSNTRSAQTNETSSTSD